MNTPKWVRVAGAASVTLVAAVAAIVSYSHVYEVAARAGEGWRAWLVPLSVDGLLVGSSLILYVRRRSSWLTWTSLSVGLLVSLAANLAAASPGLVPHVVAAWPAVALALSYEVLLTLVRQGSPAPGDQQKQADFLDNIQEVVPSPGDDLASRARAVIAAGEAEGKPVGRGTLAKHLGVPEHQARAILATLRNGASHE